MPHLELTLKKTLQDSERSLTLPRREVFRILQVHGPLSTAELASHCQATDRATVYRCVTLFEELGIVNRIWHGFKSTLELSEIFTPHHHHAVCSECGKTLDLSSRGLEEAISALAKEHGFLSLGHSVELHGYCEDCQNK